MNNPGDSEVRPKPSAVEVLRSWGVIQEDQLEETIMILRDAKAIEDLGPQFVKRQYACGDQQFLVPMFRNLYPQIRETVLEALADKGVDTEIIDKYFLQMGNDPALILSMRYGQKLNREAINSFNEKVNQLMLDKLKEHLDLK